MVASSLEGVAGLGPARRERLMSEFGSLDALRQATLTDFEGLAWLPGVGGKEHLRSLAGAE